MDSIRARGPELSLDDIAADSGVSKPVIYGHFGDRLGLADAVAVELADEVTDFTVRALGDTAGRGAEPDFQVAIGAIVTSLIDLVEREPSIYGFLVRTIRNGERGFFDNALVDVIRERGGRLVEIVNPGIPRELRQVLVDGAFGFLLFSIESWKTSRALSRDDLIEALTEATVAGFGSGVRATSPPERCVGGTSQGGP